MNGAIRHLIVSAVFIFIIIANRENKNETQTNSTELLKSLSNFNINKNESIKTIEYDYKYIYFSTISKYGDIFSSKHTLYIIDIIKNKINTIRFNEFKISAIAPNADNTFFLGGSKGMDMMIYIASKDSLKITKKYIKYINIFTSDNHHRANMPRLPETFTSITNYEDDIFAGTTNGKIIHFSDFGYKNMIDDFSSFFVYKSGNIILYESEYGDSGMINPKSNKPIPYLVKENFLSIYTESLYMASVLSTECSIDTEQYCMACDHGHYIDFYNKNNNKIKNKNIEKFLKTQNIKHEDHELTSLKIVECNKLFYSIGCNLFFEDQKIVSCAP